MRSHTGDRPLEDALRSRWFVRSDPRRAVGRRDRPLLAVVSSWFRSYGFADILDQLLIGAYPLDQDDVTMLDWIGVQRIINVVDDEEYPPGDREVVQAALKATGIEESRLPLVDFGGLPPEAIESVVQETLRWLADGQRVYLHCRAGWQRSAALASAVIAVRDGIDINRALEFVQVRKPSADPLPHQREDLRRWWDERRQVEDSDEGGTRRQAGAGGKGVADGKDVADGKRGARGKAGARQTATPPPAADGA